MRKPRLIILAIGFALAACAPALQAPVVEIIEPTEIPMQVAIMANTAAPEIKKVIGWEVENFAEGLEVPWSIVFTSDDHVLVTERTGAIRRIVSGQLASEPLYIFEDVTRGGEAGLMGMAADPQYETNRYIYACYALPVTFGLNNRIVRLVDKGGSLALDAVILDSLPSARNHAGCRLRFGPDGKLYATVGDSLKPSLAQSLDSLAGKILRINPDGSIPADNPFPDSYIYSTGHRNPQGIDWKPGSGLMFSSEHGPSGFDGPPGGDEINLIEAGGNYGWPLVSHDEKREGTIPPLRQFTPAEAPGSLLFYSSDVLPMFTKSLFFGALRGEGLVRVELSEEDARDFLSVEKIISNVGRVREVVQGPDGFLYFSTSNRDGRGTVSQGDDHIYRILPVYE